MPSPHITDMNIVVVIQGVQVKLQKILTTVRGRSNKHISLGKKFVILTKKYYEMRFERRFFRRPSDA